MASRFLEMERRTLLVQFVGVRPLTFYATSDGTDLVQDILKSQLARSNANIFGQEGSLSVDESGPFLKFEPTDTKNRTLHLPIEHLAYCGALRRMRRDPSDHRNPDQILQRDFEHVDLANRYAHYIIGPPIFVALFHGFDNALCYTFITQCADDACLAVMKLMRAFRQHEQQQLKQQGQINQGLSPSTSVNNQGTQSSIVIANEVPMHRSMVGLVANDGQRLTMPACLQTPKVVTKICTESSSQRNLVPKLICNSNANFISPPCSPPATVITQCIDNALVSPTQLPMLRHCSYNPDVVVLPAQDSCYSSVSCSCSQILSGNLACSYFVNSAVYRRTKQYAYQMTRHHYHITVYCDRQGDAPFKN